MSSNDTKAAVSTSLKSFSIGALAACGAVTFTNPFEVVKTRLQLQGELQRNQKSVGKLYNNSASALLKILRNEGISGLQRGLAVAYTYQVVLNGIRLGLYDDVKNYIQDYTNSRSLMTMVSAGFFTGVIGAFTASPLFLIKTRMQSLSIPNSSVIVGHQHQYVSKGLLYSIAYIFRNEGLAGLWRGAETSMLRTGIGSAVQLSCYDLSKDYISNSNFFQNLKYEGVLTHFSASLLTSFLVCVAMNPFDVASTRMYNQKSSPDIKSGLLYKNGFDCIQKTIRAEGIFALYKGFTAHYLRVGPHTILTFVFLEQLRKLFP